MLYDILYALAAGNGREQTLFGRCAPMSRVAFAGGLAGDAFPEIWFEVPMLGEPRFDLHTLVSHEQLRPDAAFSPGETGGCPEAFAWFARQESGVRQLALSWDLEPDRISAPAVQLLVSGRDPSVIDGFLGSVGRGDGIPAWHAFVSRLPEGWFPCYTGVFPGYQESRGITCATQRNELNRYEIFSSFSFQRPVSPEKKRRGHFISSPDVYGIHVVVSAP